MTLAVVADDAAETEFLFARLVSRHLIISSGTSSGSSRRYEYTVQGVDGRSLVVDKRTASSHPLKASGDADFWDCACCSSRGWSVEHAMICLECGAPTPVSEARLAQQRQAKRADLARERPRNLKGRRIVKEVAPHTGGGRAKGVYSMAADADQVEAGIAAEVDEQAAADSAWSARRFDSLFHLDGAVAMLTLGNQGIVREVARASLQPAAVAAAFTLAPRLVDPVDAVNSVSPAAEELTAAQVDSSGVEDDALRLRDEAVDAVRDADVSNRRPRVRVPNGRQTI